MLIFAALGCSQSQMGFPEAMVNGEYMLAEQLIENGANLNEKNDQGLTPLQQAIFRKDRKAARLLIMWGANVNVNSGPQSYSPLHLAVLSGDEDLVWSLLIAGADPNLEDSNNETPIFLAVRAGDKQIAEALIARGARLNIEGPLGQYPLHIAARYGYTSLVRLFLARGADVNPRDDNEVTPYGIALDQNNLETAKVLKQAGGMK
jgi:ankyrin repeat protein